MKKYWKWTLDTNLVFDFNILFDGKYKYDDFSNEWCKIKNNVLTIFKLYSWDGCSPKRILFNRIIVGTWDGPLDKDTGLQQCYYPSLIHDVLNQFHIGNKKTSDKLFYSFLKKVDFKLRHAYYRAVRLFAIVRRGEDGWLKDGWLI